MVEPYVCDVSAYLHDAIKEGKNILLEGQLGSLKDPDHGIYPMVTSSSTLAAYGAIGAGIPPYEIKEITTVVKAYSSAVGAGAFVSEIFGDEQTNFAAAVVIRRVRRNHRTSETCGLVRRSSKPLRLPYSGCNRSGSDRSGCSGISGRDPICVGYEIDGEVVKDFPVTYKLEKAKPVLKTLPGWKCDIRGIKKYEDLPAECRNYIETIEAELGVPVTMVSNGPGRDEIIMRK